MCEGSKKDIFNLLDEHSQDYNVRVDGLYFDGFPVDVEKMREDV